MQPDSDREHARLAQWLDEHTLLVGCVLVAIGVVIGALLAVALL